MSAAIFEELQRQAIEWNIVLHEWEQASPGLLPSGLFLVRAETVETAIEGTAVRAIQRVRHVYYGPEELDDSTFRITAPRNLPEGSSVTAPVYPPPPVGEDGYWLLTVQEGRLESVQRELYRYVFPARKYSCQKDYWFVSAFAEALEQLATLSENERVNRLKRLARSPESRIVYWAVKALSEMQPDDLEPFLEQLIVDEQVSGLAQVAADEVLLEIGRDDWRLSEERLVLLREWVTSGFIKENAVDVVRRVDLLAQQPDRIGVGQEQFLSMVKEVTGNRTVALKARLQVLQMVRWFGNKRFRRSEDDTAAFELLVQLIQGGYEGEISLVAARVLKESFSLEPRHRRDEIAELIKAIDDRSVALVLKEALTQNGRAAERTPPTND